MKGVSEVIAIILILMIVIALAALAYTWFSGIFTQLTGTAGQTIQTTTTTMGTQFAIEAASCSTPACAAGATISVTIRNTGQPTFDATKTGFYIDGAPITFLAAVCSSPAGCTPATLANGCTYTCSRARAAGDPQPRCPTGTTTATISQMKAVIATGLEGSETIQC